jgi:hypothetical protein
MAYDVARGRVVIFGGVQGISLRSDTWEWDGTTWVRWVPAPSARAYSAMTYDSGRGVSVVFGGTDPTETLFSDTWEWDGNVWREHTPVVAPPARWHHAMAYDSGRGRSVLFAGHIGSNYATDTWEWDGAVWVQRFPATSPPPRIDHAMAYDAARGRVVLFGGSGGPFLFDTWEWDGSTWTQHFPATRPSGRNGHAMAYDSARGVVVLFGGSISTGFDDQTWEWDGNNWTQRTPLTSPPGRTDPVMAYDDARGRIVLFGGYGTSALFHDTWEWDGTTWTQRTPTEDPLSRVHSAMTYDSARHRMVLLAGKDSYNGFYSDTWEYGPLVGCASAVAADEFLAGPGTGSVSANAALGTPNSQTVSLGSDGSVVLQMGAPVENGFGSDLVVYESGANAGDTEENFRVEASVDGATFTVVRDCPGDACQLDLADAGLAEASYVRITDLPPIESDGPPARGADIDAVVALNVAPPTGGVTLTETRSGGDAVMAWTIVSGAASYDVVVGDLVALRANGGNLSIATSGCLANDEVTPSALDTQPIAPGAGRWHLVRAVGCGANASYDDGSTSQVPGRDAGIQESGVGCP